jgi:ArsR family transcriptional regulator
MTSAQRPAILEQASLLSDPTRSRLLLALERSDLTVSELCQALQLPQSTISRHLKALRDGEWISARAEGTRHYYQERLDEVGPVARRLWLLLREGLGSSPLLDLDRQRLEETLRQRRSASEAFFDTAAGEWDAVRTRLFGSACDLAALPAFLDEELVVGDLGCGTGGLSDLLAPFVARVLAVDGSGAMLAAARQRLAAHPNVEVREGDLEALPLADGELDVAVIFLALHHVADPRAVLREAARALRSGGRLLVVDMQPHDREEYQREMGHVWLGFSAEQVSELLGGTGFTGVKVRALPVDLDATGPGLFVARGRRLESSAVGGPLSLETKSRGGNAK